MKPLQLQKCFLPFLISLLVLNVQANSQIKDIDTITVLPVLLSSHLQFKDPEKFQKNVHKMLLRKLAMKGYVIDKPRKWEIPEQWHAEHVRTLAGKELRSITPDHARFVALLFVEDVGAKNRVVTSSAESRIAAKIFDRETQSVVWERSSDGEHGESIFWSGWLVMLITPDRYIALEKAFSRLFKTFPEKEY